MVNFVRKLADGSFLFERDDTYFKLTYEDMKQLIPQFEEFLKEVK